MRALDLISDKKIQDIENRLSNLENVIFHTNNRYSVSNVLDKLIVKNIDKLKTQHLVIISLKINDKQTKDEIKATLQDWGKTYKTWFSGGNFNNRLVKTNIVKLHGRDSEENNVYSLTKKGEQVAQDLITKL